MQFLRRVADDAPELHPDEIAAFEAAVRSRPVAVVPAPPASAAPVAPDVAVAAVAAVAPVAVPAAAEVGSLQEDVRQLIDLQTEALITHERLALEVHALVEGAGVQQELAALRAEVLELRTELARFTSDLAELLS